MQKEKKIPAYITVLLALLSGWLIIYFGAGAYQKYAGRNLNAVVTGAPYNCDTRPRLPVKINNTPRQMRIGRRACADGRYTVGKIIQVKLHPITGGIMDDTSIPEVYLLAGIVLLVLAGVKRKNTINF
jgi:hypothetical protein